MAGEIIAASGTTVFESGDKKASVTVQVLGDYVFEADKLGAVVFEAPENATIDPENNMGFVRILNDDPLPPGC